MAKMDNSGQKELFPEFFERSYRDSEKRRILGQENIDMKLSYENVVFLFIAGIILIFAVFSLGVERGKRITQKKILKIDMSSPGQEGKTIDKSRQIEKSGLWLGQEKDFYTLQLITYNKRQRAEQEVNRLKRLGYKDTFIYHQGNLYQVCIGHYNDKDGPKKFYNNMKPRYKDCFIRKIRKIRASRE